MYNCFLSLSNEYIYLHKNICSIWIYCNHRYLDLFPPSYFIILIFSYIFNVYFSLFLVFCTFFLILQIFSSIYEQYIHYNSCIYNINVNALSVLILILFNIFIAHLNSRKFLKHFKIHHPCQLNITAVMHFRPILHHWFHHAFF